MQQSPGKPAARDYFLNVMFLPKAEKPFPNTPITREDEASLTFEIRDPEFKYVVTLAKTGKPSTQIIIQDQAGKTVSEAKIEEGIDKELLE